jgi:multidrug resistance protein, MATE family
MNKRILSLALPFLAANISIPLLGLVDTAVLGHLESEKYLGAIALGGMIFNFLFWGFSFLKMGTTGFTAQAKGRSDNEEVSLVLNRGLITALFIGILIVFFRNLCGLLQLCLLMVHPKLSVMLRSIFITESGRHLQ